MSDVFQIKRLILSKLQQFQFCDLNFTHPNTGEVLNEVCLLGANGTGKSTILAHLYHSIDPSTFPLATDASAAGDSLILTQFIIGDETVFQARSGAADAYSKGHVSWFSEDIEESKRWNTLSEKPMGYKKFIKQFSNHKLSRKESPALPDSALAFFSPQIALVDSCPAEDFYQFLHARRCERRDQFQAFIQEDENRNRTVAEVESDFEKNFPNPLQTVKGLWNHILKDLSIEFSPGQDPPITSIQSGEEVTFYALSPGLQSYFLRIALVFCQYFNRLDRRGFVFLDEPECGLNPELSVAQVQFFQPLQPDRPGQFFVATHQAEIAIQFEPENLINLEFDTDEGWVRPAAIEFEIDVEAEEEAENEAEENQPQDEESIPAPSTKKGTISRYAQLKREIRDTDDQDKLADLIDEAVFLRKL
tara:strand:+ start:995 stop:2251 length:1257 start_codon:yes stop_codon:yes gene_type:complete